ncbi:MAG: hypothetical protein FJY82_01065 [Candidatus Aminicenantes bacterium]|nr:hypothetical protein [Candidatus Aminicenantes bacterium]
MRFGKFVILGLGFGLLVSPAAGQSAPLQERARMRENLATLRLLRMTKALDLSEEQAARIFPTFNRIERDKLVNQKRLSADILALRNFLRDPKARDEDIAARLKSLKDGQAALKAKDAEWDDFLEAQLTTVQKAKYLLFQIEFYRGLADVLDRAGLHRGEMGGAPRAPVRK